MTDSLKVLQPPIVANRDRENYERDKWLTVLGVGFAAIFNNAREVLCYRTMQFCNAWHSPIGVGNAHTKGGRFGH